MKLTPPDVETRAEAWGFSAREIGTLRTENPYAELILSLALDDPARRLADAWTRGWVSADKIHYWNDHEKALRKRR